MSTREEISLSYDLDKAFFKLWLDRRMNYSCGLHEGACSEEDAQVRKLTWICRAAHAAPGMRVLDIGCGWGSALDYLVEVCGVEVAHGLTLSKNQYDVIRRRARTGVSVFLCSYLDFQPAAPYDAVISIGMLEHAVRPEDLRTGRQLEIYREFFRLAHAWTTPNAWFGLQLIQTTRIPRDRTDLRNLVWGSKTIFPGALAPRMEIIVQSLRPWWEVMEIRTRREDYALTTREWHRRLCAGEAEIRARWGDSVFEDYSRYLSSCVMMFEKDYLSLGQYVLRRRKPPDSRR